MLLSAREVTAPVIHLLPQPHSRPSWGLCSGCRSSSVSRGRWRDAAGGEASLPGSGCGFPSNKRPRQRPARAEQADFQKVPRELPAARCATAVPPARSGSQPKDGRQALPRAPRSHNSLYFHELDVPCSNHCSGILSPGWTLTHTACSVGGCSGPAPGSQHGPAAHSPAGKGHWAPLVPRSPAWNELLQPHIR